MIPDVAAVFLMWLSSRLSPAGFALFMGMCPLFTSCMTHELASRHSGQTSVARPSISSLEQSVPPPSDAAIATSLAHFGIETRSHVTVQFAPELTERGRTQWQVTSQDVQVLIGPAAFSSWGLLGSTLAHELEVHCQQNLTMIGVFEWLGLPARQSAEDEAYRYELSQAQRFGLDAAEVHQIKAMLPEPASLQTLY